MVHYNESKIIELLKEAGADKVDVVHDAYDKSIYRVKVQREGEGLGAIISFKIMKQLSDLIGTEEIDIQDQWSTDGCDTCGWGAKTSAEFVCYNVKDSHEKLD